MKPRTVLTALLLAFVAASVVTLVAREVTAPPPEAPPPADGIVLYYFHGPERCTTCLTLEAACRRAVEQNQAAAAAARRLRMESIDFLAEPGEPYRRRYDVGALSVVLAEIAGGRTVRFKTLHDLWRHIDRSDDLAAYLAAEIRSFMEPSP